MESNVQIEKPNATTRKLIVTVPVGTLKLKYDQALVAQQKKAKLKGFRQGHAPIGIIQKYYGEDIKQRLFSNVIDESYQKAVIDQKLTPVSRPQIGPAEKDKTEDWLSLERDFKFEATFEIMPEIELKQYKDLSVKKPKIKVTKKEIDGLLNNLRDAHAEMNPISEDEAKQYQVKKGDFVDTAFKGKLEAESGWEEKEGMSGSQVIEVGSGQMIPGFEDQLIGMKRGESKTFEIEFPKDYGAEDFQGKKAQFEVTANEIKHKKIPELSDDFAKEAGYESQKDLESKAEEAVKKNQEDQAQRTMQEEVIDQLIKKNPFDVPHALIHSQMQSLMNEFGQNLKRQGLPEDRIESALKQNQKDFHDRAERQVKAGLLLDRIAKAEGLTVGKEDFEKEYDRVTQGTQMKREDVVNYYQNNQKAKENLEFRLLELKTIEYLVKQAQS